MNEENLSVAAGAILPEELLADDAQAAELSAEELMGGPHVGSGAQQPESTGENGGQSGAQDGGVQQALESAVARYCAASGDARVRFLLLPDTAPGTFGARSHPGAASHRRAAQTLTAFLQQELAL